MPFTTQPNKPINQLLAALPPEVYQRLLPDLKLVELPQHKVLFYAGDNYDYAYFPTHAIISIVAIMENGSTTEIGVIGNEGMVGLPIILNTGHTNTTVVVQVCGDGLRIPANKLREELDRQGELKRLMMCYIQARLIQLGQTAACNCYHNIDKRFARWLLTVRNSIQNDEFQLTQAFISQMLGVRRSGVSLIAKKFQERDIIQYSRGSIKIIDPEKLKSSACECYQLIANEYTRLLSTRQT